MQHEALIKIKPRRESLLLTKGLLGLLDLTFYRKNSLSLTAERFIDEVIKRQREGDPIRASEWRYLLTSLGTPITQKQFFLMRDRLIGLGMIRKERGQYTISNDFSSFLKMMIDIWDAKRDSSK